MSDDTPKPITAVEFQQLLKKPLRALNAAPATIDLCEELCVWLPYPPVPQPNHETNPTYFPEGPQRKLIAFASSIPSVAERWAKVRSHIATSSMYSDGDRPALLARFDEDVAEKLDALRNAIDDCSHLFKPTTNFEQSWHEPAVAAARVFSWVFFRVAHSKTAPLGLSPDGPLLRFVRTTLERLGWSDLPANNSTIAQHLNRAESRAEWHRPVKVNNSVEGVCLGDSPRQTS